MKTRKRIHWGIVVGLAVCLIGATCQEKSRSRSDPLTEKALERYAEGRRLFLTCDPNNYQKAISLFEDALARRDDHAESLAAWAETVSMWYGFQLPEVLFQDAYMRAQRAIRLNPDLDMGYRAMADLFRHHLNPDTGEFDYEYAMEVIERAIKLNPDSAENLYVKGSIYLNSDPVKALEILNQARLLNPNLGKTYFNLASAHQMIADSLKFRHQNDPEKLAENQDLIRGHYQQAAENFETYQKLVPRDLSGYCSLGIVRLRQQMIPEAREMFEKTVGISPKPDPSQIRWRILAYLHLAQIQEEADKDLEGARTFLKRVLDLAPQNYDALTQLIRISRALKDEESAVKYEEWLKQAIESARPMEEAGTTAGEEAGDTSSIAPE